MRSYQGKDSSDLEKTKKKDITLVPISSNPFATFKPPALLEIPEDLILQAERKFKQDQEIIKRNQYRKKIKNNRAKLFEFVEKEEDLLKKISLLKQQLLIPPKNSVDLEATLTKLNEELIKIQAHIETLIKPHGYPVHRHPQEFKFDQTDIALSKLSSAAKLDRTEIIYGDMSPASKWRYRKLKMIKAEEQQWDNTFQEIKNKINILKKEEMDGMDLLTQATELSYAKKIAEHNKKLKALREDLEVKKQEANKILQIKCDELDAKIKELDELGKATELMYAQKIAEQEEKSISFRVYMNEARNEAEKIYQNKYQELDIENNQMKGKFTVAYKEVEEKYHCNREKINASAPFRRI